MSKKDNLRELVKLLTLSVAHKIGSIVNKDELYAEKYLKESSHFLESAKEIYFKENWNSYDKQKIKDELKIMLNKELKKRDFIENKKFDLVDKEIEIALKYLESD